MSAANVSFEGVKLLTYKLTNRYYTPGRGKIVPRNVTLLVGEKLCRVMLHSW